LSFIETERLLLRTWMHSDLEALIALETDSEVMRFRPGGVRDRAGAVAFLDRLIEEQDREGFSAWPVVRRSDGRVIGRCGLHRTSDGTIEISWILERSAWGQGFGVEAVTAVLTWARDTKRLKIVALIDPENAASVKLANRVGLRFDRALRAYRRNLLRYTT
jgi:RimJ/RimL family protein N-acetyltransferase